MSYSLHFDVPDHSAKVGMIRLRIPDVLSRVIVPNDDVT